MADPLNIALPPNIKVKVCKFFHLYPPQKSFFQYLFSKLSPNDCIFTSDWPLWELVDVVLDISVSLQPGAKVSATDWPADWALVCAGRDAPGVMVQRAASSGCSFSLDGATATSRSLDDRIRILIYSWFVILLVSGRLPGEACFGALLCLQDFVAASTSGNFLFSSSMNTYREMFNSKYKSIYGR